MRPSIRVSPAVITERVCGCCRIRSRPPCLIAPDTYTFIDDARSLSRPCPDALRPSGLDLCAPVFAPCLLGCPGTPREHFLRTGTTITGGLRVLAGAGRFG